MEGVGFAQSAEGTCSVPNRASIAQALVAHVYGVTLADMRAATRGQPRAALARQIAMYLSRVVFEMSLGEVAHAFGRDRSTASHAFHHIEDLRDDPELDRTLGYLETLLRGTAGPRS